MTLLQPWQRTFDYKGRATRREYWLFFLCWYGALIAGSVIADSLKGAAPGLENVVRAITAAVFWLSFPTGLAVSVRRLHDHDKTGWFLLLIMIPLLGWLFHLVMMLTPGTPDWNSYGPDPRSIDGDAEEVAQLFA